MQVCPALRKALPSAAVAALSRSASSKTMNGALPPSSSDTFFTVLAAPAISILPTAVEPVKPILRTVSDASIVSPMALASPITTLNTPCGSPARSATSAIASAVRGVSSAGLSTTVQPAARAGATLRVIMDIGKFHGVMAATTPTGCRIVTKRFWSATRGSSSPCMRAASSANQCTDATPRLYSARDSASGFPDSAVMMRAMSSCVAVRPSAHRVR
mmetsp:Transcript_7453/g.19257  ORF Transcript_7453/g.19257 Transcript_7453/m.19257 type:complete len:216 (+) Transcript_7453:566-1213(+)